MKKEAGWHGSSNIKSVSDYNPETKSITVEFLKGGRYLVEGMSPELFMAFDQAPSAGSFYNRSIAKAPGIKVTKLATVEAAKPEPTP